MANLLSVSGISSMTLSSSAMVGLVWSWRARVQRKSKELANSSRRGTLKKIPTRVFLLPLPQTHTHNADAVCFSSLNFYPSWLLIFSSESSSLLLLQVFTRSTEPWREDSSRSRHPRKPRSLSQDTKTALTLPLTLFLSVYVCRCHSPRPKFSHSISLCFGKIFLPLKRGTCSSAIVRERTNLVRERFLTVSQNHGLLGCVCESWMENSPWKMKISKEIPRMDFIFRTNNFPSTVLVFVLWKISHWSRKNKGGWKRETAGATKKKQRRKSIHQTSKLRCQHVLVLALIRKLETEKSLNGDRRGKTVKSALPQTIYRPQHATTVAATVRSTYDYY